LSECLSQRMYCKQLCTLCNNNANIDNERKGAKRKQELQANKMLELSNERFKPAETDDTVLVPIPDLDRGRGEAPKPK
jgi:hypothetical protein